MTGRQCGRFAASGRRRDREAADLVALDQAGDFFHATYGGRMVNLWGLIPVLDGWGKAIYALDALTGRQLWMYEHRNPPRTFNCCGRNNRGLAILGTTLFMNTLDMHVLAVDAKSGRELWKTKMFDHTAAGGYAAPGAPLIVKDKLIVGMAGGERGVSGFLDAYDVETGKRVWRFNTIPQPGEPNFGTWAGDSWKTGGASTWNNGSYDPEFNLVYWGTSNPWPDYNGDFRKGDNLYAASVIALDALKRFRSGRARSPSPAQQTTARRRRQGCPRSARRLKCAALDPACPPWS